MRNQFSDDHKAFLLSVALGCIASIREDEERKSFRERKMMKCEDLICETTDYYRLHIWPDEKQATADKLTDEINKICAKLFPHGVGGPFVPGADLSLQCVECKELNFTEQCREAEEKTALRCAELAETGGGFKTYAKAGKTIAKVILAAFGVESAKS